MRWRCIGNTCTCRRRKCPAYCGLRIDDCGLAQLRLAMNVVAPVEGTQLPPCTYWCARRNGTGASSAAQRAVTRSSGRSSPGRAKRRPGSPTSRPWSPVGAKPSQELRPFRAPLPQPSATQGCAALRPGLYCPPAGGQVSALWAEDELRTPPGVKLDYGGSSVSGRERTSHTRRSCVRCVSSAASQARNAPTVLPRGNPQSAIHNPQSRASNARRVVEPAGFE
jgi:hypothetical protein